MPPFDGYPYLLIQIAPGFWHLLLLPRDLASFTLRWLARVQARANRLPTALVLREDSCLCLRTDGIELVAAEAPRDGLIVSGRLCPAPLVTPSPELLAREDRLERYAVTYHPSGNVRYDLRDGGLLASAPERERLSGQGPDGLPKGVTVCPQCGGLRGARLYRIEPEGDYVVPVYCQCANWNRCAYCGELLYEWRLNAFSAAPSSGELCYAPASRAFSHTCPDDDRAPSFKKESPWDIHSTTC